MNAKQTICMVFVRYVSSSFPPLVGFVSGFIASVYLELEFESVFLLEKSEVTTCVKRLIACH